MGFVIVPLFAFQTVNDFLPLSIQLLFGLVINLFGAIDHLAATPSVGRVGEPHVLRQKFIGERPSDHYPVFADYALPR